MDYWVEPILCSIEILHLFNEDHTNNLTYEQKVDKYFSTGFYCLTQEFPDIYFDKLIFLSKVIDANGECYDT